MNRIRTLIVDDEPLARDGIAVMLERDPEVEIVGVCGDGQAAVEAIRAKRPDLAFIDVHMPRMSGIDAIEQLPEAERPAIIFVTAHDRYAIRAFETCAVDYLLKPFRDDRFRSALARAKERIAGQHLGRMQEHAKAVLDLCANPNSPAAGAAEAGAAVPPDLLVFKVGSEFVFLQPEEVIWIEAQGNVVKLRVGGQIHLVREALQTLEERLDPARFVRVHRSFLINLRHIRRIVPVFYGDYTIVMSDGTKVRLSRSYRHKLKVLMPSGRK